VAGAGAGRRQPAAAFSEYRGCGIWTEVDARRAWDTYRDGMTIAANASMQAAASLPDRLRRSARDHPYAFDASLGAGVFLVSLVVSMTGPRESSGAPGWLAVAGIVLASGMLVLRRRYPVLVLVTTVLAAEMCMAQLSGHGDLLVVVSPLIAIYTVAEGTRRRRALLIGGLAVLALAGVHMVVKPTSWIGPDNLTLAALGGLAVAAGDAARNRRSYLAEVEERARRAEQTRELEAQRRVTDERLRIARDLHDSVGHHLALINVQAAAARYLLDADPDQARTALGHINSATRSALDELRDTIGLLRMPGEPVAPITPALGLNGLNELIASFRRSGLDIAERTTGPARELPPAADLTAYRVIQESLTNICKHAASKTARIQFTYEPELLRITIDDDGPLAVRPVAGHGIVGMRERVSALGGELHAGPRPAGGFRVNATLPLPAGRP
jgi:signal transduction histidine kinase